MKIYAIFPNQKSGLIKEQLIETENYNADELRYIAFYDIFFSNRERDADYDTFEEYKLKIGLDIYDYAENKYANIISDDDLDEIVDSVAQELTEITKSIWEEREWEETKTLKHAESYIRKLHQFHKRRILRR
ncbi:MAG: hypothetical protein ACLSGD_07685 [Ruminococcus sp.]|nr:hypothetical protein [Ruminococcus bromii]